MWFKKPTIEFYSIIPEIATLAPIVPASTIPSVVLRKAADEYLRDKKRPEFEHEKYHNTARCSGINAFVNQGWVITAWQDITITTNGDGKSFTWATPIDQTVLENGELAGQMVDGHPEGQYADYIGGIPNSLNSVIKINTPWRCKIPDGYYLQMTPLPWTDEKRFTAAIGMLMNDYGAVPLNVQIFWHVLNGTETIKAGTPLAQYILVKKDQPELVVRKANESDVTLDKLTNIDSMRRLHANKAKTKCIFAEYFKK
jgi:hypothetical protein